MTSTGTTTAQLRALPHGGYFVWCNDRLDYPTRLAQHIGRPDITLVSPSFLDGTRHRGLRIAAIQLDHAVHLSADQWERYFQLKQAAAREQS